jgi:hypothetical protein
MAAVHAGQWDDATDLRTCMSFVLGIVKVSLGQVSKLKQKNFGNHRDLNIFNLRRGR